jgi:hypothetical protein
MYHRIKIIDLFLPLETAIAPFEYLELVKVFFSFRRHEKTLQRETTDVVNDIRIVPDGAFILKNHQTGNTGLFFIECDLGTERLTAPKSRDQRSTIKGKLELYDRYLTSGKFASTYQDYGQFRSFLLLFVTPSEERIWNIRQACKQFSPQLHQYYRFATFPLAEANFQGDIWYSRSHSDTLRYALVAK